MVLILEQWEEPIRKFSERENESFKPCHQEELHPISTLVKRNRQVGFQVVRDHQKGYRISILVKGGRQKESHISLKRIAIWDFKIFC